MTALTITVKASAVKDYEWQTEQGLASIQAAQEPENGRSQENPDSPGFKHASTRAILCSKAKLKCLEDSSTRKRAHYRKDEGPRVHAGNTVHKEVPHWTELPLKLNTKRGQGRETIRFYDKMREEGTKPSISIFLAALKACSSLTDLQTGKRIHSDVIQSGEGSNSYVENTVVDMYAKCGSMVDARRVFDRMPVHGVVSWNAIILGYARSGEAELALQLFARMQPEGCAPDARTFVAALKACATLAEKEKAKQIEGKLVKMGSLEKGIAIHSQVAKSGEFDIFVASTLVDMYAKCGSMVDACCVFDRMGHHGVVPWNAIILGYARSGDGELALQLFARMEPEGCAPDSRTFVAALKACATLAEKEEGKQVEGKLVKLGSLEKGIAIHSQAAKCGHELDIFVASTLVDMYAKCGSMGNARLVFDKMPHHGVVSWNAIILGYSLSGEGELALQIFARMQTEGCTPNRVTFIAALKACGSLAAQEEGTLVEGKLVKRKCLEEVLAIHLQAANCGHALDISVANTLVDIYVRCGSMMNAGRVFEGMQHHDVVSWNTIILGYARSGEGGLALQLFSRMQHRGCAPDSRTFVAALKACASLSENEEGQKVAGKLVRIGSLEKGIAIHSQAAKCGHELDNFVASTLVDMYAKCGSMVDAARIFDKMRYHDVVSWTAMILGYAQDGEGELALQLFACMQREGCAPDALTFVAALNACASLAEKEEGKQVEGKLVKIGCLEKGIAIHSEAARGCHELNIFVTTSLVDMYAKCGSMVDARGVFERMPYHGVVSWNSMILGYAQSGEGELALQLFTRMHRAGCAPNRVTFLAALKACGSLAALETGKQIHVEVCSAGLQSDAALASCLVDFYGKCGSMVDAEQVFYSIPTKDIVTWSALIAGYSRQGDTKHVFDLFERMQKEVLQANGITFLSVLTVCSHAGLVDKGKAYFQAMCSEYGIAPSIDHYNCMVDLLGRANQLDDAVAMVKNMPFEPDLVIWMTVLGACRKWTNVEVGRVAFESVVRLDEKHASAYVLMANIYGSAGMWEESDKIRAMRRNARAWKKPGQSWWTDNTGTVHKFVVGDTSHPQSEDILAKLKDVSVKMKEEGYVPDLDSVVRNISDDEKEDALCGHSEKLAIACALINTAPGTSIRIVKNLRVCDDCHKATAIISKIEQRPIICRDASRFHVFKDGKCSCGDFW